MRTSSASVLPRIGGGDDHKSRPIVKYIQCRAHRKRSEAQCKNRVVDGMTVCRYHGGNTPVGVNSVHYKHGKYSRHLPEKIRMRYKDALDDPDLMSLKHDIAVTEARLTELMEKIDSGEAGKVWHNLKKAGVRFEDAYKSGNSDKLMQSVEAIRKLVTTGSNEYDAYNEIKDMQEHRRKMTETENKMLIAKQQMIPAEQVMVLIGVIMEVIHKHVTNQVPDKEPQRALLTGISKDFSRLSVLETI